MQEVLILTVCFFISIILFAIITKKDLIIKKKPSTYKFGYSLFYSDQKKHNKTEGIIYSKLLVSNKYNIQGKPDFIFKKHNKELYIPMELKSGTIGSNNLPREGDLMQLVMYFLIIEDIYGKKPKEGRLLYKDAMFVVKNTVEIRKRLLNILEDMNQMINTGEGEVSASFVKCKHCICRGTVCEYNV